MFRNPVSWTTSRASLWFPYKKSPCPRQDQNGYRLIPKAHMSPPQYISAEEVVDLLKRQDPSALIIDVRDDDFFDGHIKGARQVPSEKFGNEENVDELLESLPPKVKLIVMHCQLSQVRGPKCARRLLERLSNEKWSTKLEKPEVKVLRYGYEGFYDEMFDKHPGLFEDVRRW